MPNICNTDIHFSTLITLLLAGCIQLAIGTVSDEAYAGTVSGSAGTITVGNSAQNGSGSSFEVKQTNCSQAGKCAEFTENELVAAQCMVNYQNKYCESGVSDCINNPILKCGGFAKQVDAAYMEEEKIRDKDPSSDSGGPSPRSPSSKATGDKPSTDPSAGNDPSSSGGSPGSGDPAACQQAAQQASSTCSSGGGGNYGSTSGGINSFAGTLSEASGSAGRANLEQGVACSNAINACQQACQSSNPSLASQCSSLGNRVAGMGQQAQSLNGAQQQAANSGQQSSASGNGYSKGTENCALNPNTEECRALAESKRYSDGKSGFEVSEKTEENFNLGSSTDGVRTQYNGNGIGVDQIQPGARNGTIANNTGGGIPGSGGDSGGARLDGARRGSPGSPGYTTDVLQGFQGGSGSGGNAAGTANMNPDGSNGFAGYGRQVQRAPTSQGLDLKRYLPGGSKQRNTRNLGGFIPFSVEINGPHVNIWSRISDRFMEKCKLGELIDCR